MLTDYLRIMKLGRVLHYFLWEIIMMNYRLIDLQSLMRPLGSRNSCFPFLKPWKLFFKYNILVCSGDGDPGDLDLCRTQFLKILKCVDLVQHTQDIWQPRLEREKGTQEVSTEVLNFPLIHGFSWIMSQTLWFLMRFYIYDHLIITTISELKYFHSIQFSSVT